MRKKIFTFILALVASVGMMNAKVTWNSSNISDLVVYGTSESYSKEGVTLSANDDHNGAWWNGYDEGYSGIVFFTNATGGFTFSNTLGKNFTKIEMFPVSPAEWDNDDVNLGDWLFSGEDGDPITWKGNASTVDLLKDVVGFQGSYVKSIVFYFEGDSEEPDPATVAVTGVTLDQNEAQMTVGGEAVTLTATVAPDEATDKTVTWTSSDPTVATVANGVVTAVAAGTATITATATNGTDDTADDFSATCDVTVSAPAPADQEITPNVDPQTPGVYYSTFFDSSVKYELPAGVEAYVADLSGANLLLTKIADAGQTIPANVAVILKSTVTPFTLTVSDADAVTFTATNDLQGSDTQIATPANCYVLAGTDGVVGFYHYTAANLNAHKAYVVYTGSNQAPRRMPFIFDQATGVENVQNSDIRSQKVVENGQLIIIRNGVRYNAAGQNVK